MAGMQSAEQDGWEGASSEVGLLDEERQSAEVLETQSLPETERRLVPLAVALGIAGILVAVLGVAPLLQGSTAQAKDADLRELLKVGIPKLGVVEAIYTYGAPATAKPPLEDLQRRDGCFKGLRSYTEDILTPYTTQVDAAAISNFYPHARMPVVVLHKEGDSIYRDCPSKPDWPSDKHGGVYPEWNLHWENDYAPRLKHAAVNGTYRGDRQPFAIAYQFVLLAYKAYDTTANTKKALPGRLPGWRLVARETRIQGSGSLYDEDPVMLVQDTKSFNCALVFTGTNTASSELTTNTQTFSIPYCGFDQVHVGYRTELNDITRDLWPRLRPKLAKCNKVFCVGHSLGGSLCELFAACANSRRLSDPDYQQQMWAQGAPEAMDEITAGGTVMLTGAERRCEEPPCPRVSE